jgi:hypothetical protein
VARSRREFLRDLLLAAAFAAGGVTLWWRTRLPSLADSKSTLAALVDTLLPADDTPGAIELGVADAVFEALQADPHQTDLARAGLKWFDRAADQPFAQLPLPARNEILAGAAGADRTKVERAFVDQLRHLTLGFYLSHPQCLKGLAYAGPPLPAGYPDQTTAPRRA